MQARTEEHSRKIWESRRGNPIACVRGTSEHNSWRAMKSRCTNPKDKVFSYYGGRGVVVCEEWKVFEVFLKDMGLKPTPKHTIERRDVNGPYTASNCYWATRKEQRANQRPFTLAEEARNRIREARTKITPERAFVVRLLLNCNLPQTKIASMLGVSQTAISDANRRRYYDI